MKIVYLQSLIAAVRKVKNCENVLEPIQLLLNNIEKYLQNRDPNDGYTTQTIISITPYSEGGQ